MIKQLVSWVLHFFEPHKQPEPKVIKIIEPTLQVKRARPRKTFTELLPVTLPIALSADFSFIAAIFDENVSGKLVPKATRLKQQKKEKKTKQPVM